MNDTNLLAPRSVGKVKIAFWVVFGVLGSQLVGACHSSVPAATVMRPDIPVPSRIGEKLEIDSGQWLGVWEADHASNHKVLLAADSQQKIAISSRAQKGIIWIRQEWLNRRVMRSVWGGAKNDGQTDDGPALEKMASLISRAGGGILDIGEGIIGVRGRGPGTALVWQNLTNVTIKSLGRSNTKFLLLGSGGFEQVRVITLRKNRNLKILGGFTIDGNFQQNAAEFRARQSEQMAGIFSGDNDGLVIERPFIYNVGGDAIRIGGSAGNSDRNLRFIAPEWHNTGRNGFTLGGHGFERVVIDNPIAGEGVDTQQFDFEPIGAGVFDDIQIINPKIATTGRSYDDYAIVISGVTVANRIYHANNVVVKGGDIDGAIKVRNASNVLISEVENWVCSNPLRSGALEIDYHSSNISVEKNNLITGNLRGAKSNSASIYVREVARLKPRNISIKANRVSGKKQLIFAQDVDSLAIINNRLSNSDGSSSLIQFHAQTRNISDLRLAGNRVDVGHVKNGKLPAAPIFLRTSKRNQILEPLVIEDNHFVGPQLRQIVATKAGITGAIAKPIIRNNEVPVNAILTGQK